MQEHMKNKSQKSNRQSAAAMALVSLGLAVCALPAGVFAKSPGTTYCVNGICHRVKTIEEVQAQIGHEETVGASFYGDCKVDPGNPCTPLSSGEELHADRPDNAASPVYPNGTVLALSNPKNDRSARVRVNNSGPYIEGRMLDVSRATAEQLGFIDAGATQLKVIVISGPAQGEE
jgi:rare lipoprotein A